MKNNNLFSQILLGVAIFITIMYLMNTFGPKPDQKEEGVSAPETTQNTVTTPATNPVAAASAANPAAPAPAGSAESAVPHENITIKTEKFTAVFSTLGAGMKSYTFNNFYNFPEGEDDKSRIPLPLAMEMAQGNLSLALLEANIGGTLISKFSNRHWVLESVPAGVEAPEGVTAVGTRLVFSTVASGLKIFRSYDFAPVGDGYGFKNFVSFENTTSQQISLAYSIAGPAGIFPDNTDTRFGALMGISGYLGGKSEASKDRTNLSDLKGKTSFEHNNNETVWAGLNNRFFASLLINKQPDDFTKAVFSELKPAAGLAKSFGPAKNWASQMLTLHEYNASVSLRSASFTVNPGTKIEHIFEYYGGPLSDEIAGGFNEYLKNIVTYSWDFLGPISRFLLFILTYLAKVTHNYGLAIICLTILVKLCLHPLTRKSMRSQHKMQLVQPLLKEIKEKYKNDRQKQQQETMRIFQENGVNPVGGCLPMLLQLPIFFALYGAFAYSFAMRQQAFIPGWISDLSLPDRAMELGFQIPLLDSDYLNLLPIVYLALQILHMGMMPKSSDPQMQSQQKMMKFMPVIFMFFFYSMPSGLVLYFTTQSLLTLVEHYFIKKKIKSEPVPGVAATVVDGKVPSGTGFGGKKNGKK